MSFLAQIIELYIEALLPPVFYCAIGAFASRFMEFDRRTLSRLTVYILLPPILFINLMKVNVVVNDIFRVILFCMSILLIMAVIGKLYSICLKQDNIGSGTTILSVTLFNSVNIGFPISLFAFGQQGLLYAAVLVAINSFPHNGLSMYFAGRGQMTRFKLLKVMAFMPMFYVIFLAIGLRLIGIELTHLPSAFVEPIDVLGQAAIPIILVCVGMELAGINICRFDLKLLGLVVLKLIVAPFIAWGLTLIIGIDGLLQSVMILLVAAPSAMVPVVYARMFGGDVKSLSQVVLWSTFGCLFTIPFVIYLVR